MADDKKTHMGTPGRTQRPTGSQATPTAPTAPGQVPATTPPPIAAQTQAKSYLAQVDDPLLGKSLAGRYVIARKLGEGGMGSVYLATHTILEKQVALKILHGEFTRKPDLVERFMQEARSASRIRHENVIDISDFGVTDDGFVFFAMELLTGHDLHEDIARARLAGQLLPWSRSKKIFLQICAALTAAHAQGIVHRDLKPENVYLVDFLGDPDFVKLLDFGIAKLTEAGDDGARKLTRTGMLFGTPEYMSPEQARGEHVDLRVDVYAMGCILFQLVTGRVPFEADNFMGVLSLHLTEPPPMIPPEVFDRIGAPRALGDIIDHALAKDKHERFQSIDALANAVREACGDPPVTDRSGGVRAPSVPAPAETRRARTPTGAVPQQAPPSRAQTPTGRQRTEWTGSLRIPEVAADPPPARRRSKLPLVIGALVVVGGGIAAAVLATRNGGGAGPGEPPPVGSGSAAVVVRGSAGGAALDAAPAAPPDAAAVEVALPAKVAVKLDSAPRGATVIDGATGKPIGKTPLAAFEVDGSHAARRYTFHLRGYADVTAQLVPDRASVELVQKLDKLGAKPPGTVGAGSNAGAGSAAGSAAIKPPNTGSATPPRLPECTSDDPTDCLKTHQQVFGSGAGSSAP